MAKNSTKQIIEDERKIIKELLKNASNSVNEIAKNCGFSRQKVWRIIKNLEKNNTIWGYVAIVDNEKLNKKSFVILIKRTNKPIEDKTVNTIINQELQKLMDKTDIEIVQSSYLNGIYDWMICITARDIKQAKIFCEKLNRLYEGILSELIILERMFVARKCSIINPEIKKLKEFV